MRWTFETMGTVVSVSTPVAPASPSLRRAVEAGFASFDGEFSRFQPDSAISRIARGDLLLMDAGPRVRDAYARSLEWRSLTNGDFTPHRPDGALDLDGIVKALAIEQAGELLADAGMTDWCLGCGGDVLMAGSASDGVPWTIGIADPDAAGTLIARVPMVDGRRAIATSGTSERGEHIWRAAPAGGMRQVTVVARDIVTADVLATAILSAGSDGLDQLPALADRYDVDVLAVVGQRLITTPGLQRARQLA